MVPMFSNVLGTALEQSCILVGSFSEQLSQGGVGTGGRTPAQVAALCQEAPLHGAAKNGKSGERQMVCPWKPNPIVYP